MGGNSGGGGNGGRSGGGGSTNGDASQPGEVVREANKANLGAPRPGDTALTANMRKYYEPGGTSVQQLPGGAVQATHPKATIRINEDRSAEVWSSRDGTKAFKPTAGSLKTYKDPMKALGEFEKRTGIIT
jgi:hypothetical protein